MRTCVFLVVILATICGQTAVAQTATVSMAPLPPSTSAMAPEPSTSAMAPGPKTSAMAPGPKTSAMAPGPSTSAMAPGPKTSAVAPGPSTSAVAPGPSTSAMAPGPSTSAVAPGPSTSAVAPGPSTSVVPSHSASASKASTSIAPSRSSSARPASSSRVPTTQPPTTTQKPTVKPIHYDVDVIFNDEKKNNTPCIWFQANVNVTYKPTGQNTSTTLILNSKGAAVQGECSDLSKKGDTSMIQLSWSNKYSFTAQFGAKEDKSWIFKMLGVSVQQGNKTLLANKTFSDNENSQFLRAEPKHAYSCAQQEIIMLNSENGAFSISIHEIEVQPFGNGGNKTASVDKCSSKSESSSSTSIVPIAVGCALAGLIVIVLIAYLIGRRKNDGRGYQQV